jgi:hypothetical protein
MSIRVVIDNSALCDLVFQEDPADLQAFVLACRSRMLSFCPPVELFEEAMGILDGPTPSRFAQVAQVLLETMYRPLRSLWLAASLELKDGRQDIFLPAGDRASLLDHLRALASGKITPTASQRAAAKAVLADKLSYKSEMQGLQQWWRDIEQSQASSRRVLVSLTDYRANPTIRTRESEFLIEWCRRAGVPDPASRAGTLLAHPDRFPLVSMKLQILAGRCYAHFLGHAHVDKGDRYDNQYLWALATQDWLVSSDGGLRKFFSLLELPGRRVLSVTDLIAEVRSGSHGG